MSGSLVLVDEFTVSSAVSTVTIGGGSSGSSSFNFSIDSTFNVYKLIYRDVFMSSSGAQNRIRFTVSGSADTSSNYDRCSLQIYTNQNIFTSNGENQDHISSLGLGTSLTQGDMGILTLFNFPNSSEYSFITREQIQTNSSSELADDLKKHVVKEIGIIARPEKIIISDSLPKTRSGKIMRRILRSLAAGEKISGDISTLEDTSVLEKL